MKVEQPISPRYIGRFYQSALVLLCVVFLQSCIEDTTLLIGDSHSRSFFYAELEYGQPISFQIYTAQGIQEAVQAIRPTSMDELEIEWKADFKAIENLSFGYYPENKSFTSASQGIEINTQQFYSVEASLIDYPEIPTINSSVYVAEPQSFQRLQMVSLKTSGEETGQSIDLIARFSPKNTHRYYEVVAFAKDLSTPNEHRINLQLETESDQDGVTSIEARKSILIDSKENRGQFIYTEIHTTLSDKVVLNCDHIYFQIRSVQKEHFDYHINLQKQLESSNSPISEPVIAYTNVKGGLGLLTGYASFTDSLNIK